MFVIFWGIFILTNQSNAHCYDYSKENFLKTHPCRGHLYKVLSVKIRESRKSSVLMKAVYKIEQTQWSKNFFLLKGEDNRGNFWGVAHPFHGLVEVERFLCFDRLLTSELIYVNFIKDNLRAICRGVNKYSQYWASDFLMQNWLNLLDCHLNCKFYAKIYSHLRLDRWPLMRREKYRYVKQIFLF